MSEKQKKMARLLAYNPAKPEEWDRDVINRLLLIEAHDGCDAMWREIFALRGVN
ncbi:MAG: hypothetical protein V6Z86_05485 [Hyphomicrobiales bacterium]